MTNAPKTVLAIHDLPGFGRAALSVIVPVLSTLGVQTVALPTAVLSTHTGGLGTPAKLANPGYGPAALEHYHRLGVKFDCIYSGYLADAAQAKLVEQAFELWPRAFKVVDPVLGDGGRLYSGLGADMVPAMYSLCSKADLIVPNVTEAALLLGDPLPGVGSAEQAADIWKVRGALVMAVEAVSEQEPVDIVVPISHTADFVRYINELEASSGVRMIAFGHAGDGNVHLCVVRDGRDQQTWERELHDNMEQAYAKAYSYGGVASGEHGIGISKRSYFLRETAQDNLAVMNTIKTALDPKHTLNDQKSYIVGGK